ncbi:MAG: Phenylalanine--tRNA ligase beta subunit [Patescibacteria group bacterium]|nr:Phenylalanine--tRNA ligase beta subunit [Patescibacteria group bacterium]
MAIAGVIGGASSAVSAETKNLLIESATFDPKSVRLTALRTGCRTDASTRYEKSLDPLLTARALSRMLDLLRFFGNDFTVDGGSEYLDSARVNDISISLELPFVASKLGIEIPGSEISRILSKLGFVHEISGTKLAVKVPSWRATKDVSIAEDMVEELGRVYGYDKIAEKAVSGPIALSERNRGIEFRNLVLSHFVSLGFSEAYAYSFSNAEKDASIGFPDMSGAVRILNAVSTEYTHMRRSPAALLFQAASENAKHTEKFAFFEYGKVHFKHAENRFSEKRSLAGVSYAASAIDARDSVLSFFARATPRAGVSVSQGVDVSKFPFLHPGKSGTVSVAGKAIAAFGSVHPKVAERYGFGETPVSYFEIDPEAAFVLVSEFGEPAFREISKFPGVVRELNFVMDERDSAGNAAAAIASVSPLVSNVSVIDVYRDSVKVGEGKRSVTFSFRIEDPEKTITDAEALAIQTSAIAKMEQA